MNNPFIGAKSYEEGDRFYGREKEIDELYNLIRNEPLTLLFSRSGTGKSSLLKAGIIPFLKKELEFLPVYIQLSHFNSEVTAVRTLTDFVIQRCKEEITKLDFQKFKVTISANIINTHSLFEFIHGLKIVSLAEEKNPKEPEFPIKPLLFFDQLEEVFTKNFKSEELDFLLYEIRYLVENEVPSYFKESFKNSNSDYINVLKSILKSKQKNYGILFAFREEYLPQFESLKKKIPSIRFTNSRFRLEPFSITTAEEIILNSAPEIRKEVAKTVSENLSSKIMGFDELRVDPFLLSVICRVIYSDLISTMDMSEKSIKFFVEYGIENYLKIVYDHVNEPTKKFIEKRLITDEGNKNSVNYNEIKGSLELLTDVDKLINNPDLRLLTKGQFLDYEQISILHDRLLPPLLIRRRNRIEKEKRNSIFVTAGISVVVIIVIAFYFINQSNKKTKSLLAREKVLKAFAYNHLAHEENNPTVALRLHQLAYYSDTNKMIADDAREFFQKEAFYTSIIKGDPSHIFYSCAISPVQNSLLIGCKDGKISLYNVEKNLIVEKKFKSFNRSISSVAFSPNGKEFLTASGDSILRVYNINDSIPMPTTIEAYSYITSAAFSPDGTKILMGSGDSVKLYSKQGNPTKVELNDRKERQGIITSLAFSPDNRYILIGSADQKARLWDNKNYNLIRRLTDSSGNITSVAFSPDGSKFITGSDKGIILLYFLDANNPKSPIINIETPLIIRAHNSVIKSLAFSPDGTQILSGSVDQSAKIFDLTGNEIKKLKGHTNSILSVAFSVAGNKIFTCSEDNTIKLWTIPEEDDRSKDFFNFMNPIISVAYSIINKIVLAGTINGKAILYKDNANSGESLQAFQGNITYVSFSPDGKNFLTVCEDSVKIWNTEGKPINYLVHNGNILSATFSNDGKSILTASTSGDAILSRIDTREVQYRFPHHGSVSSAAISKDDYVITGSYDSTAVIWNPNRHPTLLHFDQKSPVRSVAFSPDGTLAITGSEDKIVRIWNSRNGKLQQEIIGHQASVGSVAFSPDGKRIITGSDDGVIRIWESNNHWNKDQRSTSNCLVKELQLGINPFTIRSVSFLNDQNQALTISGNIARIWNINILRFSTNENQLNTKINELDSLTAEQKNNLDFKIKEKY